MNSVLILPNFLEIQLHPLVLSRTSTEMTEMRFNMREYKSTLLVTEVRLDRLESEKSRKWNKIRNITQNVFQ